MTSQLEIAQPITWLGFMLFFIIFPMAAGYLYYRVWAQVCPWMLAMEFSVICMLSGQEISEQATGWVVNPFPVLLHLSVRLAPISIASFLSGLAIRWIINRLRKSVVLNK